MLDQGKTETMTVGVSDFLRALAFAGAAVERRTSIPIVGTLRLQFDGTLLTVTGTDLDVEAVAQCDAEGSGRFAACIDGRKVARFLRGSSGVVEIAADRGEGIVAFTSGGCTLRLRGLPPEDFPEMSAPDVAEEIELGQDGMRAAFRALVPCISTEETRYYLNGLFLTRNPETGGARLVATDGHRLGIYDLDEAGPSGSGIVPRRAVDLLRRAVQKGGNAPVRINWGERWAVFHTSAGTIRTKLIDGTYPDYTRVMPPAADALCATVNEMAVARAMAVVNSDRCPSLCFDHELQAITIADPGAGECVVPCEIKGGASWAFNGRYVRDFCRVAGGAVRIMGAVPGDPFRVLSDDPRLLWILMPMRFDMVDRATMGRAA